MPQLIDISATCCYNSIIYFNVSYFVINRMKLNKRNLIILLSILISLLPGVVSASDINIQSVVFLTNQERTLNGLKPLNQDLDLDQAAYLKSANMIARNYFDHFAFGLSPWLIIRNSGYDYQIAGENLAMDFNSSEGMVSAWMNSTNHRKNILNPDFEDIGIGVVKGEFTESDGIKHETTMVTQMFGKKKSAFISFAAKILNRIFGY